MLWLSISFAAIISLAALAVVLWPILNREPAPVLVEDDHLTDLLARKDAVLTSIKELEFDFHVGKVSEDDFARFDERLRRQALSLLRQLEKVAPETADLDAQLEREITRLRKTQERRPAPPVDSLAATPAKTIVGAALAPEALVLPQFCTSCGKEVDPAHKFCGHCGAPMRVAVTTNLAER